MEAFAAVAIILIMLLVIYVMKSKPGQDGFADNVGAPIGEFGTGGGVYLDDIRGATDTIWGGKAGANEFEGGCCTLGAGGCAKCALSVNESGNTVSGINVADNGSKLDYYDHGYEPNTMANAVGNDRAYLSPAPYMSSGTNLVPAGDPYMPPYSDYNPPLF